MEEDPTGNEGGNIDEVNGYARSTRPPEPQRTQEELDIVRAALLDDLGVQRRDALRKS